MAGDGRGGGADEEERRGSSSEQLLANRGARELQWSTRELVVVMVWSGVGRRYGLDMRAAAVQQGKRRWRSSVDLLPSSKA